MATQIQAALIAAIVGLVTTGVGALLSANQAKRERSKWLVELKSGYALELYKARLATYPRVFETLSGLSHVRGEKEIGTNAANVARDLNGWLYSAGGMCADSAARGAVLGLRHRCREWAATGKRPDDFYVWRNLAIQMLRRDLDLDDRNETYDFDNLKSLLQRLKADADQLTARPPKSSLG
jgi:hypothetical protein